MPRVTSLVRPNPSHPAIFAGVCLVGFLLVIIFANWLVSIKNKRQKDCLWNASRYFLSRNAYFIIYFHLDNTILGINFYKIILNIIATCIKRKV